MGEIRINKTKKILLIKVLNRQSYACLIQHNNIYNVDTRHSDIQRSRYKFEFVHLLFFLRILTFWPSAVPIPNVKFAGHIANYLPIYFHQRLLCISIKIASYTFSLKLVVVGMPWRQEASIQMLSQVEIELSVTTLSADPDRKYS